MEWMLGVVLVVALALAIGMAGLGWRLLRGDRQRAEARALMLRQLAFEPELEPEFEPESKTEPRWQDAAMPPPVFATVANAPAPTRRWMAISVVMLFMALGAGTVFGLYPQGLIGAAKEKGAVVPDAASRRAESPPLELLSLSHRVVDDDFVVAGLVQNPTNGRPAPPVVAVVYVFNAQGEYFASGKAPLEFGPLAPGAESPFVVRLPKAVGVSRFRVGFRAEDGTVVAHVDRRGQTIDGTTSGTASMAKGR